MKYLPNIILVISFCVATVGAAGFSVPPQGMAWPLIVLGVVGMLAGGILTRKMKKSESEAEHAEDGGLKGRSIRLIQTICAKVVELDEKKGELSSEEIRQRIDDLLGGEYFDLTSYNEELANLIGFNDYAKVWEGVATAERQLSRVWSMATDGFLEEGLESLPLARANLERAQEAAAQI